MEGSSFARAIEWANEKLNMDKNIARTDLDHPRSLLLHYLKRYRLVDTRDFKKFSKMLTSVSIKYNTFGDRYRIVAISLIDISEESWYVSPKVHAIYRDVKDFNESMKHEAPAVIRIHKPIDLVDVSFESIERIKF